jgi:hypothetical protein
MEVERSQKKMLWMMLWSFVKFFGNVEKGRGILDIMTETQWQYLSLWLNSTSADCCLSFFPYYEDAAIYSCSVFCPVIWMFKITTVHNTLNYLLTDILYKINYTVTI